MGADTKRQELNSDHRELEADRAGNAIIKLWESRKQETFEASGLSHTSVRLDTLVELHMPVSIEGIRFLLICFSEFFI